MNGAKKLVYIEDFGEISDDVAADYLAVERPTIKRARPIDKPSNRERRERRDMVYLILRRDMGLSPDEISVTLRDAARSASQIRRRIKRAAKGVVHRRFAACG